jgi:hypothetical protein
MHALITNGLSAFPLIFEVNILENLFGQGSLLESIWPAMSQSFIGPLRDPIKNMWGIEFGMIACILLIPLALICGPIRGLPFFWTLIDCAFGVFGIIPLAIAYRYVTNDGSSTHRSDLYIKLPG